MSYEFIPIKTRVVHPPKDDIYDILEALPPLKEGDIVFITSKIMGIHQGRTVPVDQVDKTELIKQEADSFLSYTHPSGFNVNLTINDNVLIPAAGIDASNADGYYIMWPKEIDKLCAEFRAYLCKKNNIKNLGVVSTDSHTTPLRYGVTGITIGLSGIEPLKDYRGHPDIFGRELAITQVDEIDPLASMAVLLMGESDECTPIVLLRGWDKIEFNANSSMKDFKIDPKDDLYTPLLSVLQKCK
ncbi:MAG: coenzyme F420-0:L-glutamate ligase [Alphaproteobacteria bacterium]|nr:coenzyme F420-0:L-glutamate ligase [Alphaproteobacteria bacterium]